MISIVDYEAPALLSHRAGAENEKAQNQHMAASIWLLLCNLKIKPQYLFIDKVKY